MAERVVMVEIRHQFEEKLILLRGRSHKRVFQNAKMFETDFIAIEKEAFKMIENQAVQENIAKRQMVLESKESKFVRFLNYHRLKMFEH